MLELKLIRVNKETLAAFQLSIRYVTRVILGASRVT